MTEIASTTRRRRLSTRAVSLRLVAASFLASAAIAGGLAIQMANGHDPELGAGTANASAAANDSSQSQSGSDFGQSQDQPSFGQSTSTPGSVTSRAS